MLRAGLKILLKDALRSARDQMRRSGEGGLPLPGAQRLSRVADDVLSSIEETVVCVRYGSDQTADLIAVALEGVVRLRIEGPSDDFDAGFAATIYRLAKGLLALRGLDRIRLSERGLAMAGRDVRVALQTAPDMTNEAFAAEIALALIAAEPLRDLVASTGRHPDPFVAEPDRAVGVATGLVLAAWLDRDARTSAVDCARSAVDIVTEAWPRFTAALNDADPRLKLAALYAEVAPFAQ
jgi:hypothetical protein